MDENKWIIDTDPGCDDMIAIFYLLTKLKGNIDLISITQGNCKFTDATRNIKRILSILNYQPLVMCGSNPIIQGSTHCYSFHKDDGLGNIKEFQEINTESIKIFEGNSVFKIIELCLKNPKKVNIFSIGPVTNLALAFMIYPNIINLIGEVYLMGGSTHSRGNQNSLAEMNFGFDPISTKIVLNNYKNIVICTWECCELIKIHSQDIKRMMEESKLIGSVVVNKQLYDAIVKILQVFDSEEGGLEICDFYSIITFFNKNVVTDFSLCLVNSTIDGCNEYGNGMLLAKKVQVKKGNYKDTLRSLKEQDKNSNYKVIVESIDPKICYEELCSIFLGFN